MRIRILASGAEVFNRTFGISPRAGEAPVVVETRWGPDRLAPQGYRVVAELVRDEHVGRVWRQQLG